MFFTGLYFRGRSLFARFYKLLPALTIIHAKKFTAVLIYTIMQ